MKRGSEGLDSSIGASLAGLEQLIRTEIARDSNREVANGGRLKVGPRPGESLAIREKIWLTAHYSNLKSVR